jgi:hypothetical protein
MTAPSVRWRRLAREFEEERGLELRGTPRLIASTPRVSPNGRLVQELTYLAEVADGAERLSHEHDQPHRPSPALTSVDQH